MKTSVEGRKRIMEREGVRLRAYRDSVGVLTIGVGHTSAAGEPKVTPDLVLTRAQVDEILSRDLLTFERAVNKSVKVPLSQGQFDALVSLAFNIGGEGFKRSTVVRRLNAGNYRGAADAILLWNKPSELMPRRKSERAQFLSNSGTHVPGTAVRFMPKQDLHDEEEVSAEYLRASDSRVVKGVDSIKTSISTISGAVVAAGGIAGNVSDLHEGLSSIGQAAGDTKDLAGWLYSHWSLIVIALLFLVIFAAVYRIWVASNAVEVARVEDAAYTPISPEDA